jgi:hypothetical protein
MFFALAKVFFVFPPTSFCGAVPALFSTFALLRAPPSPRPALGFPAPPPPPVAGQAHVVPIGDWLGFLSSGRLVSSKREYIVCPHIQYVCRTHLWPGAHSLIPCPHEYTGAHIAGWVLGQNTVRWRPAQAHALTCTLWRLAYKHVVPPLIHTQPLHI